ncbi:hypothetical protein [Ureibacillus acetophenoni]|uniref:Uncharacterized protein n=1 Tax=Ureibacillus acetophenoni TaxID=614649 RepID=A0A285UPB1_9BACL|nr:hypothetical protein [Ureibacillus acetophenoni]SOC43710.1 hypothetical protein SAMN05877842_11721 [Ureibacillus acetophenoni]
MSKPNKPSIVQESIFLVVTILINILALPAALVIGVMATDSPGSGMKELVMGFLFVQAVPLILFAGSLILFIIKIREIRNNNEIST